MSNINSNIVNTSSLSNPTHKYAQPERTPEERHLCSDCGVEASIDGGLPVDLFVLNVPVKDKPTFYLCLGDLASRRALGQEVRRV